MDEPFKQQCLQHILSHSPAPILHENPIYSLDARNVFESWDPSTQISQSQFVSFLHSLTTPVTNSSDISSSHSSVIPSFDQLEQEAQQWLQKNLTPICLVDLEVIFVHTAQPISDEQETVEYKFTKKSIFAAHVLLPTQFKHMRVVNSPHFGTKVSFILPKSFYYQDQSVVDAQTESSSVTLEMSVGNNFQSVTFDSPIVHNFQHPGTYSVSLRKLSKEKVIAETTFQIQIESVETIIPEFPLTLATPILSDSSNTTPHPDWSLRFQASISFENKKNFGRMYAFLHDHNTLVKPLLVVDAFPGVFGPATYADVYDRVKQVLELNKQYHLGLDVLMVTYDTPLDDVRANAMVIIESLVLTNKLKKSPLRQNIVIGPSMGGLIARLALTYAEEQQLNHQVAQFFSLDSPHQGATLPLSVQTGAFAFGLISTFTFTKWLNQPAINQMLKQKVAVNLFDNTVTVLSPHPARTEYLQWQTNIGSYPKQCKNLALSDGRGDQTNYFPKPASFAFTWLSTSTWSKLLVKQVNMYYAPCQSDVQPCSIFDAYLLGGLWSNRRQVQQVTTSWETASGGQDTFIQMIVGYLRDYLQGTVSNNSSDGMHCFIPTVSALDLIGGNENPFVSVPFKPNQQISWFTDWIFSMKGNLFHCSLEDCNMQQFIVNYIQQVSTIEEQSNSKSISSNYCVCS